MIFDKTLLGANDLAHGSAVTAMDMGNANVGPGKPIKLYACGSGATALAGATGLTITDCDTTGGSYTAAGSITATNAEILAGLTFDLPTNTRQFVKVDLAGTTSAGAWTCGVILEGAQSNV